jgi:hypothetical protein
MHVVGFIIRNRVMGLQDIQGGSNMTETDFCVNKPHMSRSYLNHLVFKLIKGLFLVSELYIYAQY